MRAGNWKSLERVRLFFWITAAIFGFHSSALLNGPGALEAGEERRRRVLLKGRAAETQPGDGPRVVVSPTVGCDTLRAMYGRVVYRMAAVTSEVSQRWETNLANAVTDEQPRLQEEGKCISPPEISLLLSLQEGENKILYTSSCSF